MAMGTDALLQGINMYLQGLLADKEKRKEDQRKLDYIKNVYVQNNMLEKQYNPEKVTAQKATDKEKAAKSNLYLSLYPQLEEIAKLTNDKTISDLLFSKEIQPKEREAKTKDLDKKLNEYNYWFQNIDSQRKDEENDKKLNRAIRAQQLANAKANGDLLSARLASMKNADEARANGGSGGLDRLDTYQLMKLSKEITDSLAKQRNDYTGENFDKLEEVELWRNQLGNIDKILRERGVIPGGNSSSGLGSKLLEMTRPLNDLNNKIGNLLNKQLSTPPSTTAIGSANKDQQAQIDEARKIQAVNNALLESLPQKEEYPDDSQFLRDASNLLESLDDSTIGALERATEARRDRAEKRLNKPYKNTYFLGKTGAKIDKLIDYLKYYGSNMLLPAPKRK